MRDAVVGDYIFYQRSDLEPRGVGVGDNYKSAFARKLFQKALFFAVVENTEAVRRYDKSVDDRGQSDFIVTSFRYDYFFRVKHCVSFACYLTAAASLAVSSVRRIAASVEVDLLFASASSRTVMHSFRDESFVALTNDEISERLP